MAEAHGRGNGVTDGNGDLIGVTDIGRLLSISRPNVYRWIKRRGLQPVRTEPLPVGRLYSRVEVLGVRDSWLEGRDREQDERRRATAIARRER
jgi:hypothetical protein